jgi:hypothetical protein
MGDGSQTVTFSRHTQTQEQMKALPGVSLKNPRDTAALTMTALSICPQSQDVALKVPDFPHGSYQQRCILY